MRGDASSELSPRRGRVNRTAWVGPMRRSRRTRLYDAIVWRGDGLVARRVSARFNSGMRGGKDRARASVTRSRWRRRRSKIRRIVGSIDRISIVRRGRNMTEPRWRRHVAVERRRRGKRVAASRCARKSSNSTIASMPRRSISGTLEVTIEGKSLILEPGDSIYFDSKRMHCFRALNDKPATFVCIII